MKKHIRNFKDPQNISKHLFCSVCHEVYRRPVVIACGHTFCKHCIQLWKVNHKFCPNCRQTIQKKDNLLKNLVPQQIIDELEVNCASEECKWTGQLQDLEKHYTLCKLFGKMNKPDIQEDKAIMIEEELYVDDGSEVEIVEVKNLKAISQNKNTNFKPTNAAIGIQKTIKKPLKIHSIQPRIQSQKEQQMQRNRKYSQCSNDQSQEESLNDISIEEEEEENNEYSDDYYEYKKGLIEADCDEEEDEEDYEESDRIKKISKKKNRVNIRFEKRKSSQSSEIQEHFDQSNKQNGHHKQNIIQNILSDDQSFEKEKQSKVVHKNNLFEVDEDSIKNIEDIFSKEQGQRHKASFNNEDSSNHIENVIDNEVKQIHNSPTTNSNQQQSFSLFNSLKYNLQDVDLEKQYSNYLKKFSSSVQKEQLLSNITIVQQSSIERKNTIINDGNLIKSDSIPPFQYGSPSQNDKMQSNENNIIKNCDSSNNEKSTQKSDNYILSSNKTNNKMDIEHEGVDKQNNLQPFEISQEQQQIKSPIKEISQINQHNEQDNNSNHKMQDQNQEFNQQWGNGEEDEDQQEEESKCNRVSNPQVQDINYSLSNVNYKELRNEEDIKNKQQVEQNQNDENNHENKNIEQRNEANDNINQEQNQIKKKNPIIDILFGFWKN